MFFGPWTPEQIEQWVATYTGTVNTSVPVVNTIKRCGGCGKFLPKDLTEESYVILEGATYHMVEKCLTKGVIKARTKNPNWDWPMKEEPNES